MKIAVTGHRPDKLGKEYSGKGPYHDYLKTEIIKILHTLKPTQLISGMALGVDQLFAEIGIGLGVPVIAAVPFVGQERIWPEESKLRYKRILDNPLVETRIISKGGYASAKMQVRNIWMVDNCDKLVACWNGTPGGTKNCVDYAISVGKEIIRINPEGMKTRDS